MMRNKCLRVALFLCAALFAFSASFAQDARKAADRVKQAQSRNAVFSPVTAAAAKFIPAAMAGAVQKEVRRYSIFQWGPEQEAAMRESGTDALTLTLPTPDGASVTLTLVENDIFAPGFAAVTSDGRTIVNQTAHYYQGIVNGDEKNLAAISIFNDEIAGFFTTPAGNYVVGKLKKQTGGAGYNIVYKESDLTKTPGYDCFTPATTIPLPVNNGTPDLTTRCVRMYFETEVDFYSVFGNNATSVSNYVTNLFNQVKTLYNNDGVSVALSQIFIWTTTDPYTGSNTSTTLSQFQSVRTSFNGDVGQLLTTRALGGGLAAVINGLCSTVANRLCVSGNLTTSFPGVPTYSWEVMVTTHEFGHLLGSRHTHACVWNGNNTAIDGCSGFVEGSCALPGIPSGGGTIMSYCHITSAGINFSNGFGPQPAQQIRNTVEAATCLTGCTTGGGGCNAPVNLFSFGDCGYADMEWGAVSGASSYTLEYKRSTSTVWTVVNVGNTTFYTLFASAATYNWRVKANCASGSSAYTNGANFRIIAPGSPACFLKTTGGGVKKPQPGENTSGLRLTPQPARGQVNLQFNAEAASNAVITVHNQFGIVLISKTARVVNGSNIIRLDIGNLKNGVYTVQVQSGAGMQSAKLSVGE
jgi:hypothetical protein